MRARRSRRRSCAEAGGRGRGARCRRYYNQHRRAEHRRGERRQSRFAVAVADAGPLDELGERDVLEHAAGLLVDADPHLLQDAVALAVVGVLGQRQLRAFDRGDDVGERDLARAGARARSRRRRRASSARAPRLSPTAGSARGTAAAGACARRSPSPTSAVRCRAARATAARGPHSRRASRPSCAHRSRVTAAGDARPGVYAAADGPTLAAWIRCSRRSTARRSRAWSRRCSARADDALDSRARAVGRRGRAARARRARLERGAGARGRHARARGDGGRRDHDRRAVDDRDRAHVDRDRARARAARHRRLPHARRRRRAQRACAGRSRAAAGAPDPFDVQRHTAVPRPRGAGRDARPSSATPASRRRTCAAAGSSGWHTTVGARRAVRARGRGGRAVRLRVLPGRRHDRARVRAARPRVHARARASPTALVGELVDALPARAALLVTSDHGQIHLERDVVDRDPRARRRSRRRWRATAASATSTPTPGDAQASCCGRGAGARARTGRGCGRAPSCSTMGVLGAGATGNVPGPHRQRRARGARAGRVRRPGAAERADSCARATAASRPTRCTCRCSHAGDGRRDWQRQDAVIALARATSISERHADGIRVPARRRCPR